MQKIITLILFLFTCTTLTQAQSLNKLLSDKNKNFKDVEWEIHKNHALLNQASPHDRKMYERWKWFWNTRVDSSGSYKNYDKAMKQTFDQLYPNGVIGNNVTLKSASSLLWTSLGPSSRAINATYQSGRGRFKCIWVDPGNHNHILIGANSSGLWETTNGGINWNCNTQNAQLGGVSDVAVDPGNHDVIYITTSLHLQPDGGLGTSDNYSLGIFKSTNGGDSWSKLNINAASGEFFQKILMVPGNSSTLFALSNKTVYKSTNSGSSWSATSLSVNGSFTLQLIDMLFKPNDPNTIYVSGRNCFYKTTNGGSTWTNLSGNLNSLFSDSRITIATSPLNEDDLYAFYCDATKTPYYSDTRLEKSTDDGSHWSVINSTRLNGYFYTLVLSISPSGDIYLGGMKLYKSTNDGQTFSTALSSGSIHDDFSDIYFPDSSNNDLLYVTNDGGVFMDDSGGTSWTNINGDLATNEFYDLAITTQNPEIMIGGTQDCGTLMRNSSGNWVYNTIGGDGGTCLIDQSNSSIYYFTVNDYFYRYNGGNTLIANLQFLDAPVYMDPTNSNILYYHTWESGSPPVHFKKSTDKGSTWTTIDHVWDHVHDITVCESNTDYMYYSIWDPWASSDIRRTTDGGSSWTNVGHSGISDIIQVAPINGLYVHPFDPQKVWAVFGGFESGKKVYYSENGGDSWTNITGTGLPNLPIQCFTYDFLNQTMFVGTDVGVYYCTMGGTSWGYAYGAPRAVISGLHLNELSGDLVVSTFGRGIWRANLGEGYCYNSTPLSITSNTTWSTDNEVCSDVVINSGATLTVTANITLSFKGTVTVKSNATLTVDSGELKNGKVVVENGGNLIIKNNGKIKLNNSDLEVQSGATLDYPYGEIDAAQ